MSTPSNPMAGAAVPVTKVVGGNHIGMAAIPVYGYTAQPTDGRAVLGGPAMPVVVISSSDLIQNGGTYSLVGMPEALPIITAPASTATLGQDPIAVYPVNGWS